MGLVFEENVYKRGQTSDTVSTVKHLKPLTPQNRKLLEALGVTFHNHVVSGIKSSF